MANPDTRLQQFLAAGDGHTPIAHIQGPHGCGKSTRWLRRIWELAGNAHVRLIYIQPTTAQARLLSNHVQEEWSPWRIGHTDQDQVSFLSIPEMIKLLVRPILHGKRPLQAWRGSKTIICMDLEVNPSAAGEFLVHHLSCEWAQRNEGGADILITFGVHGHRYSDHPRLQPVTIELAPPRELVPIQRITRRNDTMIEDTAQVILNALSTDQVSEDRVVIAVVCDRDMVRVLCQHFKPKQDEGCLNVAVIHSYDTPEEIENLAVAPGPGVIFVGGDDYISFPIRNVCMVIYGSSRSMQVLDNKTGLIGLANIQRNKAELLAIQGLARYHSDTPDAISHLRMDTIVPSTPVAPRAYSGQLLYFALLAIRFWKNPWNVCNVPHLLWKEAVRTLRTMGLVELLEDSGKPWPTNNGQMTLSNMMSNTTSDIHVACLLAWAQRRETSPATKRVICVMAAILDIGLDQVLQVDGQRDIFTSLYDLVNLFGQHLPFDPTRIRHGGLWVAVALWNEFARQSEGFVDIKDTDRFPKKDVYFVDAPRVLDKADRMAELLGLKTALPGLDDSKANVLTIERALFSAYAGNVVFIPSQHTIDKQSHPIVSLTASRIATVQDNDVLELDMLVSDTGTGRLAIASTIVINQVDLSLHGLVILDNEASFNLHDRFPGEIKLEAVMDTDQLLQLRQKLATFWGHPALQANETVIRILSVVHVCSFV